MDLAKPRVTPVVCVANDGYTASLELGKIYPMLPDGEPGLGLIRVIDESGEDYLFSSDYFEPVEISPRVAEILQRVWQRPPRVEIWTSGTPETSDG